VVPVSSPPLLAELEAVLAEPRLRPVFPHPAPLLRALREISLIVEPRARLKVARSGPSNRLLEAARASDAGYIVTSDIELLRLGSYAGAKIVRPHPG
jgi:putative PIN family toxin of toxin-antitoxin system